MVVPKLSRKLSLEDPPKFLPNFFFKLMQKKKKKKKKLDANFIMILRLGAKGLIKITANIMPY